MCVYLCECVSGCVSAYWCVYGCLSDIKNGIAPRLLCIAHMTFVFISVDGNWGSWSSYGSCSKTCGGGTQTKTRSCNNPIPQYGGITCNGSSSSDRRCNTNPCPGEYFLSSATFFLRNTTVGISELAKGCCPV